MLKLSCFWGPGLQVKKKMTKEQFVKNNRGINDSRDLPKEYLEGIFDAIEKEEIRMKGQSRVRATQNDLKDVHKRTEIFAKEMRMKAENATEAMKSAEGSNAEFLMAQHKDVEHVRPMFKLAWQPLLAALTRSLNDASDPQLITMVLEGLLGCIHVACVFTMDLERRTFVQSLAKFTNLATNLTELKHKQVESIRALLQCALDEGNFLEDSWKDVLSCVSQLELVLGLSAGDKRHRRGPADTLSETAAQHLTVAVDKIFTRSKDLNGEAIVEFVRYLCVMSMDELQLQPPRMYSLSKLVEIAYYNMERIRLQWSHIWVVMGDHFNKVLDMASVAHLFCVACSSLSCMETNNKAE